MILLYYIYCICFAFCETGLYLFWFLSIHCQCCHIVYIGLHCLAFLGWFLGFCVFVLVVVMFTTTPCWLLLRHNGQRDYKCGVCDFYGYTFTDIRKHIERKHSDVKTIHCDKCSMPFKSELQLRVSCKFVMKKVIALDRWMDGLVPNTLILYFVLVFCLRFSTWTSGRHLNFSIMRSVKFFLFLLSFLQRVGIGPPPWDWRERSGRGEE